MCRSIVHLLPLTLMLVNVREIVPDHFALFTHKVLRNIQTSVHSAHTVEMMKLANIYNNFAQAYPVCASRFVREIERLRRCRNRFPWQFYVCFNLVCSIFFLSLLAFPEIVHSAVSENVESHASPSRAVCSFVRRRHTSCAHLKWKLCAVDWIAEKRLFKWAGTVRHHENRTEFRYERLRHRNTIGIAAQVNSQSLVFFFDHASSPMLSQSFKQTLMRVINWNARNGCAFPFIFNQFFFASHSFSFGSSSRSCLQIDAWTFDPIKNSYWHAALLELESKRNETTATVPNAHHRG